AVTEAAQFRGQGDGLGDAVQRELTVDEVVVDVGADAGGAEAQRGVLLDVEEVGATDVLVALRVGGVDARGLDGGRHGGVEDVLGGLDLALDLGELAADLGHAEVAHDEAHVGVYRVDGPGARQVAGNGGRGAGHEDP